MGLPKTKTTYTVEEYLKRERAAVERSQYLDGEIFAMAGESPVHGDVTANLVFLLVGQLKGKPCKARIKDTKVRSGPSPLGLFDRSGLYSYPDIVVICGVPLYHDDFSDVVLNPSVIIEVLSPSTEAFDRGEKFRRYHSFNPTLTDYLLVSQDLPEVDHFHRQSDENWILQFIAGLKSSVAIDAIGCTLKLAEIYDGVDLPGRLKPRKARQRKKR